MSLTPHYKKKIGKLPNMIKEALGNSNVQHWNETQWEVLLPNVFKMIECRVELV
jgi:hypothetical protein